MSTFKLFIAIASAAAAAYAGYKLFVEKVDKKAVVKSKECKTEVRIERFEETDGSGWTVPDGAFDVKSKLEIKRYNYVNGYGVPVYATKYSYKVKRWTYNRTASSDTETIDVEKLSLKTQTGSDPQLGDERMLMPTTKYAVMAADYETGEFLKVPVSKEIYSGIKEGDILTYKVRRAAPKTYTNLGIALSEADKDEWKSVCDQYLSDSDETAEKTQDGDNSDN